MHCILHPEKHPSASVFFSNKTHRYEYKDFHTGKVYHIVDLLLDYFSIPDRLRKVFRLAFASFLIKAYASVDGMNMILKTFETLKTHDFNLAKTYFLLASLNEINEAFIGVRDLSFMLGIKNLTQANRILNLLCLIGVLKKYEEKGFRKANCYELETVDLENLKNTLNRLKALQVQIYQLSEQKALEIFDKEKVERVYKKKVLNNSLVKTLSRPDLKKFSLNSIAQQVANNEISREKALKILKEIYKGFSVQIICETLDKLTKIYTHNYK
jgi:hypothetical protein